MRDVSGGAGRFDKSRVKDSGKSSKGGFEPSYHSSHVIHTPSPSGRFLESHRRPIDSSLHLDSPLLSPIMNRTPLDKGAARSRKRAQQLEKAAAAAAAQTTQPTGSKHGKASQGEAGPSRPRGPSGPNGRRVPAEKKVKEAPEPQSRDPSLYKAKAIRSATALVWPCTIPPPSLEGITRVDLTNSGVKNVEWLRGSGVRWLGLSGCKVDDWDVIGTLQELTGECGDARSMRV
jgi:hypothetical protein